MGKYFLAWLIGVPGVETGGTGPTPTQSFATETDRQAGYGNGEGKDEGKG